MASMAPATRFARPEKLKVERFSALCGSPNGRSWPAGPNDVGPRLWARRGGLMDINKAAAAALSQNGKSGRFDGIYLELK